VGNFEKLLNIVGIFILRLNWPRMDKSLDCIFSDVLRVAMDAPKYKIRDQ